MVVEGGFWRVRGSLRPGTMNGHGYVTLPSRPVGVVLGDLDVSTGAAWSTGHSAIHSLVTWSRGPFHFFLRLECGWGSSFGWSGKFGEPLRVDTLSSPSGVPLLFMQRGVRLLTW